MEYQRTWINPIERDWKGSSKRSQPISTLFSHSASSTNRVSFNARKAESLKNEKRKHRMRKMVVKGQSEICLLSKNRNTFNRKLHLSLGKNRVMSLLPNPRQKRSSGSLNLASHIPQQLLHNSQKKIPSVVARRKNPSPIPPTPHNSRTPTPIQILNYNNPKLRH